jgi:hypothetical protein
LKRLLPGYNRADGYNDLFIAVPVPEAMMVEAAEDFGKRGDLANYVGQIAFNAATTSVRASLPIKLSTRRRFVEAPSV